MCTTVVAGRMATASGWVMVGHNEDDSGRPAVRHGYVPPRTFAPGSFMPAEEGHAAVPQVARTFGFYWSEFKYLEKGGSSFCDSFANDNGVLVCSNSARTEAPADEKAGLVDGGIGYNLRRATAERATSARHAVDVLADLVSRWGYASPGRIYTLADSHEAWIVQVKHGRECYVARRVPDGEVALIPGNEVEVRFGLDTARVVKVDAHIVTEGDGLHDHGHIVVAVGAPFGRVEGDVELGVSLFVYGGQDMYLRIFESRE